MEGEGDGPGQARHSCPGEFAHNRIAMLSVTSLLSSTANVVTQEEAEPVDAKALVKKRRMRKMHNTPGASLDTLAGFVQKQRRRSGASRGWGRFHSVAKERSVAFNLTLDIQKIRQEIQDLIIARELLQARAVHRRHDPVGSLMKKVEMYFHVFGQGYVVPDPTRSFGVTEQQQRTFLLDVADDQVDIGNGMMGVQSMGDQLQIYAQIMRCLALFVTHADVITSDDSVTIKTTGRMRFQILPETILGIFPHVVGNDRILSKLVGQEIEQGTAITFYFNARDKISKYEVDSDFMSSFMDLLQDPADVDLLLGRALIADNYLLGVVDEKDLPQAVFEPLGFEEGGREASYFVEEQEIPDFAVGTTGSALKSMPDLLDPDQEIQDPSHEPEVNDSECNGCQSPPEMSLAFILG